MKHHIFTQEQRKALLDNPNFTRVLNSNVDYSYSFKAYALKEYEKGKLPLSIFKQAGIPDFLNIKGYAKETIKRWKRQKKNKIKPKVGRPRVDIEKSIDDMSIEELKAKLRLTEELLDFAKKIRAL